MSGNFAINHDVCFEVLNKKLHNRNDFNCGNSALDYYLRNLALQQQNRNLTRVHVGTTNVSSVNKPIFGYYCLCASKIDFETLPEDLSKGMPIEYTIPGIKLGRLARDLRTSKGFGLTLLADALCRILLVAEQIGIYAIQVDAKNSTLAEYYKRFGFVELLDHPNRLVMSRITLSKVTTILKSQMIAEEVES